MWKYTHIEIDWQVDFDIGTKGLDRQTTAHAKQCTCARVYCTCASVHLREHFDAVFVYLYLCVFVLL